MIQFLLLGGLIWGVMLAPAVLGEDLMSVCVEEDEDVRVDCHIKLVPNRINSYEFSMNTGSMETLVNTNISGSSVERRFRDRSSVELEPDGYRLTLTAYAPKLSPNTTFMCKVDKKVASVHVEKDNLAHCSAVAVFLQNYQWMIPILSVWLADTHL